MINKRKFFRVEVLKSVNIYYNGGYYKGKVVELSAGGAKIKCKMNLMEQELFDLSFKINGEMLVLKSRLVRYENLKVFCVEFIDVSETTRQKLIRYLNNKQIKQKRLVS